MTAVRNDLRSSIMTVSVHVSFTLDDIMTIMFLQSPLCLEVPGNQMGHRGTAPNDKSQAKGEVYEQSLRSRALLMKADRC